MRRVLDGECNIPPLDEGMSYTQIAAGQNHTVLLRSDGVAVAFGHNHDGQCNIPPLGPGIVYTQVSAGSQHTVLLQSDGRVIACGKNSTGRCDIPSPDPGHWYIAACLTTCKPRILQLDFLGEHDAEVLTCYSVAGEEILRLDARGSDLVWDSYKRISCKLNVPLQNLQVVFPDGELLVPLCRANPAARLADVSGTRKRRRLT